MKQIVIGFFLILVACKPVQRDSSLEEVIDKSSWHPISQEKNSKVLKVASSVVLLSDLKNYRELQPIPGYCSGGVFHHRLDKEKLILLTAGHCLKDQSQCDKTVVIFNYDKNPLKVSGARHVALPCDKLLLTSRGVFLPDVAVATLKPAISGNLNNVNIQPLEIGPFQKGNEQMVLIAHPNGMEKYISRCTSKFTENDKFVRSSFMGRDECNQVGGSSGGIFFGKAFKPIALVTSDYDSARVKSPDETKGRIISNQHTNLGTEFQETIENLLADPSGPTYIFSAQNMFAYHPGHKFFATCHLYYQRRNDVPAKNCRSLLVTLHKRAINPLKMTTDSTIVISDLPFFYYDYENGDIRYFFPKNASPDEVEIFFQKLATMSRKGTIAKYKGTVLLKFIDGDPLSYKECYEKISKTRIWLFPWVSGNMPHGADVLATMDEIKILANIDCTRKATIDIVTKDASGQMRETKKVVFEK